MTPAALFVCMAIVTNVGHGSVVTRTCHYELPAVAMNTVNTPAVTEVKALAIAEMAVKAKPRKPKYKKPAPRTARPTMTAAQDKAFRHSWYKRLADM